MPPAILDFSGATGSARLHVPVSPEVFRGVRGTVALPAPVSPQTFHGAQGAAQLPLGLGSAFEGVQGGFEVQVEFPGGGKVFVGYGMGVPLGVEEPILQPTILLESPEQESEQGAAEDLEPTN